QRSVVAEVGQGETTEMHARSSAGAPSIAAPAAAPSGVDILVDNSAPTPSGDPCRPSIIRYMVKGPVFCPHLGTKFDKGTQWGYPSQLASCYLDAEIPYSPSLAHQQRFCLSDRFPGCFRLVEAPAPQQVAETEEELRPEEVTPRGGRLRAA